MILVSVNSLYRHYHQSSSKSLSAIICAIDGVIEPLLMLISAVFQTLLSIRHQNGQYCQKFCRICCKSRHKATSQERPYVDMNRNEKQTNPPSNPLNQPSHTHFSVPYTGAFTQVTVNSDKYYLCIKEYTPLIRSGNTAWSTTTILNFINNLQLISVTVLLNWYSVSWHLLIINPRRMREGYGSRSVCVSVCYHASCYIPHLRVQTAVL